MLVTNAVACEEQLNNFFTEVEWLLHDKPVRDYDYYYDQVVCIGELLSTSIISHYLNEIGIKNKWIDVRDIFEPMIISAMQKLIGIYKVKDSNSQIVHIV